MRSKMGFTLIELLIVVAIIAILAAIAVPNFLEAQTRAKIARVETDMRTLAVVLETYYVDHNQYALFTRDASPPDYLYHYEWLDRWIPTTTPIAYQLSVPNDVFMHRTSFGAVMDRADDARWSCYVYNRGDTHVAATLGSTHPTGAVMAKFGKSRWMINAAGPDNNIECESYWSGEEVQFYTMTGHRFAVYDPTNGTTSEGEIFRWSTTERLGAQ
jgi:general secretion pathway protein G